MLKGIPEIISPELLKVLAEMGHGDEICFGDANFPAESVAGRHPCVRADGHPMPELLQAVLTLFPLDSYVPAPVVLMEVVPAADGTPQPEPEIWARYRAIVAAAEPAAQFETAERFAYYERAKNCYAVVATGEHALYANIILKKGVL
jgi:L-fucose mutarotase